MVKPTYHWPCKLANDRVTRGELWWELLLLAALDKQNVSAAGLKRGGGGQGKDKSPPLVFLWGE